MVFNSLAFFVFFFLFFHLYWWICKKKNVQLRNGLILAASYLFYGWWDWRFLSLIIISSLADFYLGKAIHGSIDDTIRKRFLITSLVINLGILGVFKYFNFFVGSLSDLLDVIGLPINTTTLSIVLPVGISFYTFQTLSYSIDIYRRQLGPTEDLLAFFSFVAFFPQLVAGPIERASRLLPQFFENKQIQDSQVRSGLKLMAYGFFKKIVIADNFGLLVDQIFVDAEPSGLLILVGSLFFAIQIYCDFSGYSDIAIGVARMLGFDLMTNFKTPYFSKSFTELWYRWHISLSSWFRDYLYFPLGGSRKGSARQDLNIMITFLLSGLWHGAQLTFVLWGGLHGLLLILEKRLKWKFNGITGPLVIFISFAFLLIPFRANDMAHFGILLDGIFSTHYALSTLTDFLGSNFTGVSGIIFVLAFLLFFTIENQLKERPFDEWVSSVRAPKRWALYYTMGFAFLLLVNTQVKPFFVYFQF